MPGKLVILCLLCGCALAGCRPRADLNVRERPGETVYYGVVERIRGFDPVMAGDVASALAVGRIYEGLLQYAYLERPYRLEPCLAAALPTVSADGLVYTFPIRSGIYFQDDPCFQATGGKGRELTAEDFVYSLKRLADLKTRSIGYWVLSERVVGLDEFRAGTAGERPTDYDALVAGVQAPDRYTLRLTLKQPYPQLLCVLAMSYTFAVPREAVTYYGPDFINHPVGTGPYRLADWRKNYRLEFERNPKWAETGRVERYPTNAAPDDVAAGLLADAGRPIPFVDRVTQFVIQDSTTMWLMFLTGQLEASGVSRENWDAVIAADKTIVRSLAERGIRMYATPALETYYIGFNMDDPVVGTNQTLRQALTCAFNSEQYVRFYNDRFMRAKGPVPPGIAGFDAQTTPYPFDLARARQLLAAAGYPEGQDPKTGRRLRLTIDNGNASDPDVRAGMELIGGFLDAIGVQLEPIYNNWPTFLDRLERRQVQCYRLGWVADYPDAENFLQLFYGPNSSPGPNHSNYVNKEFDALYERVRVMADSPERTALYRRMAALVVEDAPWIFTHHPMVYGLHHGWLKNYKPHDFPYGLQKYHTIDTAARAQWKAAHQGGAIP